MADVSEMVDRVAAALSPLLFSDDPDVAHRIASPLKVDAARDKMREKARAAIEAMREPTEAMYEAVSATGKMWRETNSTEVYRAMIDGALRDAAAEKAMKREIEDRKATLAVRLEGPE